MRFPKGPCKGQKGVYKLFKEQHALYDWKTLDDELRALAVAEHVIHEFNHDVAKDQGRGARRRVELNMPEVWRLGERKVLVEPFIEGVFEKFNSNTGWAEEGHHMMQALSHYSYHLSGGRYLLCDLQGARSETHYVLTDPAVLSTGQEFGCKDGGMFFMENFFKNHKCNGYCNRKWLRMSGPRSQVPMRSGTSFVPRRTGRSAVIDGVLSRFFSTVEA